MGKKKAIIAVAKDGSLYVRSNAIMSDLCLMVCGLTCTVFGNENIIYLAIDDAIEWCKEEAKHTKSKKHADQYGKVAEKLEGVKSGRVRLDYA